MWKTELPESLTNGIYKKHPVSLRYRVDFFLLGDATCAIVVICPVTAGEVGVGDRGAGIGGMDKLTVAGINANMGNAAGICIFKEYQVSRSQAAAADMGTHCILICSGAVRRIPHLC